MDCGFIKEMMVALSFQSHFIKIVMGIQGELLKKKSLPRMSHHQPSGKLGQRCMAKDFHSQNKIHPMAWNFRQVKNQG